MANISILAAFERMWKHVVAIVSNKSDKDHTHDNRYYTESEVDTKLDAIDLSLNNLTNGETTVAKAEESNHATSADHATNADSAAHASSATTATQLNTARTISLTGDVSGSTMFDGTKDVSISVTVADDSHNHTISNVDGLQTALNGKASSSHTHDDRYYTETEVDELLESKSDTTHNHDSAYDAKGSADTALDTAKEYTDSVASGKANSSHTHSISNVTNLQSSLDAKVPTSRTVNGKALTADITLSASDVGAATSGHTHSSYVNQNAFSNVKVGTTTVAADTTTDTLEIAAGTGISVSGDATNDKVTITNSGVRSISTGTSNGTISVNTNGTSANVAVKGLGSAAYTASTAYDASGTAQTKADAALASAKSYTDTKISDLINGAPTTLDTLGEIATAMADNADVVEALETAIGTKANATHSHAISDVSGLQSALDGKAASSHGTHVSFDSTNKPKMDGTSAFGTSTKVARADHVHPTDTSRASQTDLDALETVVAGKANASHGHSIADVTNLQSSLDAKQATITGGASTITGSNLTASRALVSNSSGKVAVSDITSTELGYLDGVTSNIQTQLDGKASSGHTHNYAGSSSAGGAATSANKVNSSLTVKLNGGTTEGTNMFTFNGSAAKAVNITPSGIGAAASSHTHDDRYYTETEIDTKLSGKADSNHTHNYAGSSSAGGSANSAVKWSTARNINGMSVDGSANRTNYGTCSTAAGTAAKTVDCAGFALVTGAEITVKFTVSNAVDNPTLNVNNTGAKPIFYRGAAITKTYLVANRTYTFRYDGTNWDFVGDINVDTNTDTKVTQTNTSSTNADYRVLLSGTADDTSRAESARKSSKLKFNPSTGTLTATKFNGTATDAENAVYADEAGYANQAGSLSGVTASATELNYMDGVTSNVQTQLDTINSSLENKFNKVGGTISGGVTVPNITITDTCPLFFQGNGNGTYNIGAMYVDSSSVSFETPRTTDTADGTVLPLKIRTRGGQYAPLYAGNIYSNDSKVITHRSYAHLAMGDDSAKWLKININQSNNIYGAGWMMCFTIRIYQSYRATDIQICGYNYSSNYWYLPSAKIICDSQGLSKTVTFGYDGIDKLWVAIACGNYSGIDILDVTSGYYDAEVSFDINPVDSLTGTIQSEQTIYPPITQNAFSYSNGTLTITT